MQRTVSSTRRSVSSFKQPVKATSSAELTLRPGAYDWQFVAVDGSISDAGDDVCR